MRSFPEMKAIRKKHGAADYFTLTKEELTYLLNICESVVDFVHAKHEASESKHLKHNVRQLMKESKKAAYLELERTIQTAIDNGFFDL